MVTSILLVEDDRELGSLIKDRLAEEHYQVVWVETGPAALESVKEHVPHIVLLDIMLPEMDGLEVCRRLRAEHPLVHVIMLTARSAELDRIVGLEVGADDYVTKPFSLQELVARVRAAVRKIRLTREGLFDSREEKENEPIRFGRVLLDRQKRRVEIGGREVHLTVREYDLLAYLASHPDRPFTRSQLLETIWNIRYEGYDRTVDSHIQRLRAKIEEDPGNPSYIRTVWGIGYRFQPDSGKPGL
jgi:DNA-binding response OmpR family regulator